MLDLKFIREHPDAIEEGLRKRNTTAPLKEILALDATRRELLTQAESLKHQRNSVSERIGRTKEKDPGLIAEMRAMGDRIAALDHQIQKVEEELRNHLLQVPNLPHPSVPLGKDDTQNVVARTAGQPREFDFEPLPHWDLGPMLGIIDFERAAKISGSRFFILQGAGARLERALINWMLDLHTTEHGYIEVDPPALVRREMMVGAAQLPKLEETIFHDSEDDLWLIGTGEIPLTNLHRDEILEPGTLPRYYVSHTPCFRREKVAHGRDVRGIKRVFQFDKVEMYKFTAPDSSYDELERLVQNAEEVCRRLEIPFRVKLNCSGDMGFAAAKTYDVEMWAPGAKEWLEVSSCSNCEDFQARRANIRIRRQPGAKPEFVHTLNGSGLALPRTMIAIIENYQEADGSIVIPKVLRPYMGGAERISGQR